MMTQRVRPLQEVDDDGFAKLVARDIKGQTDLTEYNLLRMPENVVRWHRELTFIKKDIEDQIVEIKLSDDPTEITKPRLMRIRTVLKHVHRDCRLAQYAMDQHGLLDDSDGKIISALQALENVIVEGRVDDAKRMIENILDSLESRTKENS